MSQQIGLEVITDSTTSKLTGTAGVNIRGLEVITDSTTSKPELMYQLLLSCLEVITDSTTSKPQIKRPNSASIYII